MFHHCSAGAKIFPSIITGTQHHNITTDLCALSAIEVDKDTTFGADLDGRDPLPSAVVVLEPCLCWRYENFAGVSATSFPTL